MVLRDIQERLNQEGMTTQFKPASTEQPLDQLLVLLEVEEPQARLVLELVYVPDVDDEFETVKLLQFFATLPLLLGASLRSYS